MLPLVARGLQRLEQGRHPGDQLVYHAAIMADRRRACSCPDPDLAAPGGAGDPA